FPGFLGGVGPLDIPPHPILRLIESFLENPDPGLAFYPDPFQRVNETRQDMKASLKLKNPSGLNASLPLPFKCPNPVCLFHEGARTPSSAFIGGTYHTRTRACALLRELARTPRGEWVVGRH